MPLVSRSTIKSDWLNIAAIDNSRDALIDRLIGYADAEIKDICQQPIAQEVLTFTFEGNYDLIYDTGYSVPVSLTSLSSRSSFGDAWTAITTGASIVEREEGLKSIYLQGGFTSTQYQAVVTIGYGSVPSIIELCAAELVTELYNATPYAAQANRFGVDTMTESEGGVSLSKRLVSMRKRIAPRLAPYRRVRI